MTIEWLETLGRVTLEPLWLPTLTWTLLAFLLVVPRPLPARSRPLLEARLYAAALMTLPAGLIVGAAAAALGVAPPVAQSVIPLPAVTTAPTAAFDATTDRTMVALGGLTLAGGAAAAIALVRFVAGLARLGRLQRHLPPAPVAVRREAARLCATLGVRRPVRVLLASEGSPLTFGWRRPVVALPRVACVDPDRDLILRHELLHIAHADFARHVAEQVVQALFALHPLVHLLHRRAADARERACDAALLAETPHRRSCYARLLIRFADARTTVPAVGIIHRPSLTSRLLAMTRAHASVTTTRLVLATAVLFALGTLLVACTDSITEAETTAHEEKSTSMGLEAHVEGDVTFVVVEQMPRLLPDVKTGMSRLMGELRYPQAARADGAEGRVFVEFVVRPDGSVTDITVTRGVHPALDTEAVRAVQQLRFEPGRQRGVAVPVRMTLPVTFRLEAGPAES